MARTASVAGTIILIAFGKLIRRGRWTAWGGTHQPSAGTVRMFAGRHGGAPPGTNFMGRQPPLRGRGAACTRRDSRRFSVPYQPGAER